MINIKTLLQISNRKDKKFQVRINSKTIHFGAKGMSDYTIHQDPARKQRYLNRHQSREDWTSSGIETSGFWSRWLLWNKPSLKDSIKDIEKRFNLTIQID